MNPPETLRPPSAGAGAAPDPTPTDAPFARFDPPPAVDAPVAAGADLEALRAAVSAACREPEPVAVARVLEGARLPADVAERARALAARLAGEIRACGAGGGRAGLVQALLHEYALSTDEGIALMCVAEALLRIPDPATRDALIRDKLAQGRWHEHLGRSPSPFVNAATWGLLVTGRLAVAHDARGWQSALARGLARGGEPLVRAAMDRAMRTMGEQFVTGETIGEALARAARRERQGFRHSFDMLGEAAATAEDARRYLAAYTEAIDAIGAASAGRGPIDGPGISIKLSALHPRYQRSQRARVHAELYPDLLGLCVRARGHGIGLNIDAEEADRLALSLELLERLCAEPSLAGWDGLGTVVQAYQKRATAVVDLVVALARRTGRRLMVRLVKGAYWDTEIKRAQQDGLADYPVFTRKPHTDVSYLACARALLAAPDAVFPQFATHNAHTLAAIRELAGPARWRPGQYEFQCLHGMGETLYERVVASEAEGGLGRPCRIYAPVGTHETLLAYLVRRLLENGANTSFVNRIADPAVPIDELVRDPVEAVDAAARDEGGPGRPHPSIPRPPDLLRPERANSAGLDLADDATLARLGQALRQASADAAEDAGAVRDATEAEVDAALAAAHGAVAGWSALPAVERARRLAAAADALEADRAAFVAILVREAGRTVPNALAEVREAVDFLRFHGARIVADPPLAHRAPLGPVVCISPWNFPLAIFIGQVAAALAAGNAVLAKPAEQTPRVAARAVAVLHAAGVHRDALRLLPGEGPRVGARLVADPRVRGVLFTGSTEVARRLQALLADRVDEAGHPIPLVAETGGQNAMIVDASALPEQVVADVLVSAFDSAGQRCSALRVLCVQEEAADRLLAMLRGAMAELRVGRPDRLDTDVGPVIDADARAAILRHVDAMRARGHRVHAAGRLDDGDAARGHFVRPTLVEIDDLAELEREVFGPVLHVLRWRRDRLDALLDAIDATGYALTLGLHTRIDDTVDRVAARSRAGNLYVNRSMVGAVVGVQPFGGTGLSGTGPKAGGPLYLDRLLARPARDIAPGPLERVLPGPTGERNVWRLVPRAAVACVAGRDADLRVQLEAVIAAGARAVVGPAGAACVAALPEAMRAAVTVVPDPLAAATGIGLVLLHGDAHALRATQRVLAARPGPIVAVERFDPGEVAIPPLCLLEERVLTINTAAAGGNASLMTMG